MHAVVPAEDTGTCVHCGESLVFKPFYLDGKLPNPPIWQHDGGSVTCRIRPKGWRKASWPTAEPEATA